MQPTPEHEQTATVPRLHQCGQEETEPCQNLMIFHMGGKKTETTKLLLLFSSFPNTSDLGFLIKCPTLPPSLELPLGTSCVPIMENLLFYETQF